MASRVPTELINLILENVANNEPEVSKAALSSCCLAGKFLIPLCQKHLFREVTLQPGVFEMPKELVEGPDITLRFAKLVQKRPHLASYVRHLIYRFSNEGEVETVVEEALKKLRFITHLELHVENPFETGFAYISNDRGHARAILSLVERPQLKTLVLRNLKLPIDSLVPCLQLQSIELHNATCFYLGKSEEPDPDYPTDDNTADSNGGNMDLPLVPLYIREFKLSGPVTLFYLGDFFNHQYFDKFEALMPVKFTKIRTLHVPVSHEHSLPITGSRQTIDIYKFLLSRTQCLAELHLQTAGCVSDGINSPMSNRLECPLAGLHPGAFTTLTSLSYTISIFHQFRDADILDPYHGLLRNDGHALKQLVGLEALTIAVRISRKDMQQFNLPCFGDAWGSLPDFFSVTSQPMRRPLDKLKRLSVSVGVAHHWDQDPELFLQLIQDELLRQRFHGLRSMAEERGIELMLNAPVLAPGDHNIY